MEHVSRRRFEASLGMVLVIAGVAGCRPPASPGSAPALVEPAVFTTWPRITGRPMRVSAELSMLCTALPPHTPPGRNAATSRRGPHADASIVVRVSPNAVAAYRDGGSLPVGAVVIKEKYADASASGPLLAYGVMTKREAGFDSRGGDWEYAYVALEGERAVTRGRGRLQGCAGCHASARDTDYLFRSYDGVVR